MQKAWANKRKTLFISNQVNQPAMKESRTCLKIQLCAAFEALEDQHWQDVLMIIQNELGYKITCQCLLKSMFVDCNDE